ncbi:MAG: uracil-DNA glycosylase [Sedimentisphaerales bacterium]|nr:uracil-DNA glycosylase [Sedimentisphaerales bacterium]
MRLLPVPAYVFGVARGVDAERFFIVRRGQSHYNAPMTRDVDTDRVVRQHLEMDDFLTGFVIKGSSDVLAEEPKPSATDVASATQELETLAEEVRQCRKCDLGGLRTNAVPGAGHVRARIMFIGEAPGADEDAQGKPFVGRAGQLLDKIIAACGLKREDVFIGNILKCRPPDNRDPRPDEIISCLPYLQRQIEIIAPEVIIALGAHAARTLLETNKSIGQLRGHFEQYCVGIGRPAIKVMATYHPAYLLRSYTPDNRRRVWEDMKKVLVELDLPVPETGRS